MDHDVLDRRRVVRRRRPLTERVRRTARDDGGHGLGAADVEGQNVGDVLALDAGQRTTRVGVRAARVRSVADTSAQ
ncbi:hypothetical protein [Nocardioides sp. CCNWLW212]|uniref:hypothetical protein n=1 Tax=Nocardioides sp. CCNWLW212 TaxID=3128897 RepID=UPI00307F6305